MKIREVNHDKYIDYERLVVEHYIFHSKYIMSCVCSGCCAIRTVRMNTNDRNISFLVTKFSDKELKKYFKIMETKTRKALDNATTYVSAS